MKIYTRTGDAGETSLLGGRRVRKSAPRVEAYGEVDELNAALGVAAMETKSPEVRSLLEEVQRDLFAIGSVLADAEGLSRSEKARVDEDAVRRLEGHIDRMETSLPPLRQFILPGGSPGGALLHFARSVARRAERQVVSLSEIESVSSPVVSYLNRLSDLLFVLARVENQVQGVAESRW
jgi:cob(I)alamin adenosyltransferase